MIRVNGIPEPALPDIPCWRVLASILGPLDARAPFADLARDVQIARHRINAAVDAELAAEAPGSTFSRGSRGGELSMWKKARFIALLEREREAAMMEDQGQWAGSD